MDNCLKDEDIDLLIITKQDSLWLVRLVILLLSPILGINRRRPKDKEVKNKISFNLFLEENHLKVGPENLFLAHEICQMKPIYNKDETYLRFFNHNKWVSDYLPNSIPNFKFEILPGGRQVLNFKSKQPVFRLLNYLAYRVQLLYMESKRTIERVSLHQAFFHPHNLQERILKKYQQRLSS